MPSKGIIGEITEVRSCTGLLCIEWRILHFLKLSSTDYYDSPSFFFHNASWHMSVYPCSSGLIYLRRQNLVSSINAIRVTVGIRGSAGVEKKMENEWQLGGSTNFLVWECCSKKELSEQKDRLMPDDALTITFEIKILQPLKDPHLHNEEVKVFNRERESSEKEVPLVPNEEVKVFNQERESSEKEVSLVHNEEVKVFIEESESSEKESMEQLQNSLRSLLKGGEDCDVTIKVRDKEFRAHRLIMRARSPVFHAMFSHNMLEKQKGVVTMNDTDPETFPDFLEHVYTGSVRMISADNVISLFVTSDKYNLIMLKKECARFMRKNMTVASFCDVISVAVRHNEEELLQRATEFFCNNSLEIIKTAQWEIFMKENTTVGNELLIKLLSK